MIQTFDFEKPIHVLEEKIKKTRESSGKEISKANEKELLQMEEELEALKKSIYGSLTAWQKIQIARHPERPSRVRRGDRRASLRWGWGQSLARPAPGVRLPACR